MALSESFHYAWKKFSKTPGEYEAQSTILSTMKWCRNFKGIVHQFWIYNIFSVFQQKKHFLWKVHLDKTTITRNNWESRVLKVSLTKYCYIHCIYNTDWLWAPYFLNYFESELFYRDGPFIKNISSAETRQNFYIYSKLVNNRFKISKS